MALKKRIVKGKTYFYVERNLRLGGNKWKTFSTYAGSKKPNLAACRGLEAELGKKISKFIRTEILLPKTEFIDAKSALALENIRSDYAVLSKKADKSNLERFLNRRREEFITNTNTIEGSQITLEQTRKILKLIENFQARDTDELEVVNMNNALDFYDKLLERHADIDEKLILALHLAILKGVPNYEQHAGSWRQVNVYIRNSEFQFPIWQKVPSLMQDLLDWYHANLGKIHPLELAAEFHVRFVTIHPFADGNGRMARLLMNYILQSNGFPFTDIPFSTRDEYFSCQEKGHFGVFGPFVHFLMRELRGQFKKFKKEVSR